MEADEMFRALPSATEEQGSEGSGIGPWPNGARKRAASAEEHLAGGVAEVRSVPLLVPLFGFPCY